MRVPTIRLVRPALPGEVSWATLRHCHAYLGRHEEHVTTHGLQVADYPSDLPVWRGKAHAIRQGLINLRDAAAGWGRNDLDYACRYLDEEPWLLGDFPLAEFVSTVRGVRGPLRELTPTTMEDIRSGTGGPSPYEEEKDRMGHDAILAKFAVGTRVEPIVIERDAQTVWRVDEGNHRALAACHWYLTDTGAKDRAVRVYYRCADAKALGMPWKRETLTMTMFSVSFLDLARRFTRECEEVAATLAPYKLPAAVVVLVASAAEAFVNEELEQWKGTDPTAMAAAEPLQKGSGTPDKWQAFLSKSGGKSFDPSTDPFDSFLDLVKLRNVIVHRSKFYPVHGFPSERIEQLSKRYTFGQFPPFATNIPWEDRVLSAGCARWACSTFSHMVLKHFELRGVLVPYHYQPLVSEDETATHVGWGSSS